MSSFCASLTASTLACVDCLQWGEMACSPWQGLLSVHKTLFPPLYSGCQFRFQSGFSRGLTCSLGRVELITGET